MRKRTVVIGAGLGVAVAAVAVGTLGNEAAPGDGLRLPPGYRLQWIAERNLLAAAGTGQPAFRVRVYASPLGLEETIRDLERAYPAAREAREGFSHELRFGGKDAPRFSFADRGPREPVLVYARGAAHRPAPWLVRVARALPWKARETTTYRSST